ncbi:response regulator [Scytonema sp. UIC 10036]|uniref:response regulator n=1 Tax=Scytonema sp. UIC 10036 TaxID=2304196 RepID=UPI0012DA7820|nr:response regulator [Scytonema sp. UIC 10036]MUG97520.1 response regulator [Scytonema sp. UIC 10036]
MQPGLPSFTNLAKGLAVLSQQRATGELIFASANEKWHLYLFLGRLLYATRETHRVRRWYRVVKQDCPSWKFENHNITLQKDELWEYHLLKLGLEQNQLTLTQAKSIVGKTIDEVLFNLVTHSKLETHWVPKKLHPIALIDVKPCLYTAVEQRNRWRNMDLGGLNPDTAPIVKQPNFENFRVPKNYFGIIQLVNGENTIWDLASHLQQPVLTVANDVQQLVNHSILELSAIHDRSVPVKLVNFLPQNKKFSRCFNSDDDVKPTSSSSSQPITPTNTSSNFPERGKQFQVENYYISNNSFVKASVSLPIVSVPVTAIPQQDLQGNIAIATEIIPLSVNKPTSHSHESSYTPQLELIPPSAGRLQPGKESPLIAYIDDSRSDSLKMTYILTKSGYRCITIQESVSALTTLLENKPSLIFLDLVMPIANGYEICAQIRRVSALNNIPIIIVTSNDGIVDRVRAKMAGSSGFLAKPIAIEKVLKILQKHLPNSVTSDR